MIAGNAGEVKVRLTPALGFARQQGAKGCFSRPGAEQFSGIGQGVAGDLIAAEQAGQLIQTALRRE